MIGEKLDFLKLHATLEPRDLFKHYDLHKVKSLEAYKFR